MTGIPKIWRRELTTVGGAEVDGDGKDIAGGVHDGDGETCAPGGRGVECW